MFWRVVRRLLGANRGRLMVILLALGSGAAVTAALLNLQVDARRRLTTEFRAFGANVVVAPRDGSNSTGRTATFDEGIVSKIPPDLNGQRIGAVSFLYLIANVRANPNGKTVQAVLAGRRDGLPNGAAPQRSEQQEETKRCDIGVKLAAQLNLRPDDAVLLRDGEREEMCRTGTIISSGGAEDNEIFVSLGLAQRLGGLPGQVSIVELTVAGRPEEIASFLRTLEQRLPEANVRGVRQFTEAEAKIYNRISGVLSATVALVLVLTGLCVMAAMTNVAMERRNDVGLMKAIGGAARRVLRLFLAEAAVLGLVGGAIGAACGLALSMWLGKAVFGMAARPRLIVYPVSVALTTLVAILGAYPLKRLASIRPASIFRGEA